MTSIITGDLIHSRKKDPEIWLPVLKRFFNTKGSSPSQWEIYRGDSFQLEIKNISQSLLTAIEIKALIKNMELDVRMSIGIGDRRNTSNAITETGGTAFIRSGETFETLKKEKRTLALNSGDILPDEEINLMLKLIQPITDHWTKQAAEVVVQILENPGLSQEETGKILGISQTAVSKRLSRSQLDLVMEVEQYYRKKAQAI